MSAAGYVISRPIEFNIGRYTPGLTESNVNLFHQEVQPTDFNADRCSFQFKSPGLNTLLSSAVYLEFDLQITVNSKYWDYESARAPNFSMVRGALGHAAGSAICGATPTICFGEGNVLAAAMQSYQLVINGAALQNVRMDEWKATTDKVFFPSTVMQRRFGRCGGGWNAYDSVACSGQSFSKHAGSVARANIVPGNGQQGANAAAILLMNTQTNMVAAYTQDSGIAKRIQGLLACTKARPVAAGQTDTRIVRVRAPLEGCGIFNFMGRQDYCSSACPLRNGTFCIPHANVVQINILFKNLFKTVIRNLSANRISAAGANFNQGGNTGDIAVAFPAAGSGAKLIVDYLRLASWRQIPATRTLAAYRVAVHDPSSGTAISGPVAIAAGCLQGGAAKDALPVIGCDRFGNSAAADMGTGAAGYIEAVWSGLTMSQIPTNLAFLYQKSTDAYDLQVSTRAATSFGMGAAGNPPADRVDTVALQNQAIARNTTASAAPIGLDLMIQSSIGSYVYSSDNWPYLKGRSQLFRDTMKNSYLDYCSGCEFIWERHNGVIFLNSADYARGLGSEGSSMPVVFNAKCRFENRREFISGGGASCDQAGGPAALRDGFMFGKPLLLAWFPRMSLALSPSAGLVSSQNISHASALQLLSQTQA